MTRIGRGVRIFLAAAVGAVGCAAGLAPAPDLGGLYNRAAQSGDAARNPVILVPGILGSTLVDEDSGRVVWGAFGSGSANPNEPDARLVALPLKGRVAKAVLVGAAPPIMLKTPANPSGLPLEVFGGFRAALLADRAQFFRDIPAGPFHGVRSPRAKVSQGIIDKGWRQGIMCGVKAAYDCIKAFSETDFTEDLRKIDVPTLITHGDDDQVVPIGTRAMLSSKLVCRAQLKVYQGFDHGMCTTLHDVINADRLSFFKPRPDSSASRH